MKQYKVGCDPEFVIRDWRKKAHDFEEFWGNTVGWHDCDEKYEAEIGTDGDTFLGELRPAPGTPKEVVNRLGELLNRLLFLGFYPDILSPNNPSVGGHIHLEDKGQSAEFLNILAMFHWYKVSLPLYRIRTLASIKRHRHAWGFWERKDWGYELRTPSSAWILSPDLALWALEKTIETRDEVMFLTIGDYIKIQEKYHKISRFDPMKDSWKKEIRKIIQERDNILGEDTSWMEEYNYGNNKYIPYNWFDIEPIIFKRKRGEGIIWTPSHIEEKKIRGIKKESGRIVIGNMTYHPCHSIF